MILFFWIFSRLMDAIILCLMWPIFLSVFPQLTQYVPNELTYLQALIVLCFLDILPTPKYWLLREAVKGGIKDSRQ